jgi:hypothetical protein
MKPVTLERFAMGSPVFWRAASRIKNLLRQTTDMIVDRLAPPVIARLLIERKIKIH